jgi:TetR/AcrR family transcriptional regulator
MTASAPATRRQRPSADQTRERILRAAREAFSQRGFDGASTREIAGQAGVTQPLLNYHFTSKDELWRATVDDVFASLHQAMTTRADGLRGVEELTMARLMVHDFIAFSARNPELHRIITQECKVDGPRMDWLVERHIRPLYEVAIAMFTSLARSGHIAAIPPAHLYYILTGAGPTMFVLGPECRRLSGLDPTSDDVIATHADAVCQLLFGNL